MCLKKVGSLQKDVHKKPPKGRVGFAWKNSFVPPPPLFSP